MFDWNYQELSEIWGEAGMSDDHIVPYPKGGEDTPPGLCGDDVKKEEKNKGYSMVQWPKTDWHDIKTEASSSLVSMKDVASQLDNGCEFFRNQQNDNEQNDIDDYGWANIGSFDDLDKIFSIDDDSLSGHGSLDNIADELWLSFQGEKSLLSTMDSPGSGPEALSSPSGGYEMKRKHEESQEQSLPHGYGKMSSFNSYVQHNVNQSVKPMDYAGGEPNLVLEAKVNSQDQGLKALPNLEGIRAKQAQDCSSNWFPQPTRRPAQLPHVASLLYASESSAGPLSGSHGASEPPRMTPQEKIEKLRRRQQLRALYAIQKQQKQLSTDVEESVGILPTISTNENDESNAVPMVVDDCHTMEDTILYQLQNTVSKLDFRVRISIRDSLFRLAQSTKQRQYFGDSSRNILSSNKCKGLKQDKNTRCSSRPPDVETETNPIDRGVAHLLFHRPINNFNSKPVVSLCHGSKNPDLFSERSRSDNGPCTMDTSENASSDYN